MASLSGAGWGLLAVFGSVLLAGLVLGVVELARTADKRARVIGAAVLTAAGLLGTVVVASVGPGGGFMRSMSGMGSMMGGGQPGRSGSPPASAAPQEAIAAKEFAFTPALVQLKVGETVNIAFDNRGTMFHTLTIAGLGLDLRANAGDQIAGSLRPDHPGTYDFICSVPGHAGLGMRGKIEVVAG